MGKTLIAIIVILVAFGWAIASGFIRWESGKEKCLFGKSFQSTVPRQTLMTMGRLYIYYQPLSWTCPEDEKYRADQYRVENGVLVPIPK